MANLTVMVRYTLSDAPATGLTLVDIDLYLYRVNKSTGVWSNVWNGQNPDTEVGGGAYSLLYGSADFETYDYWHYGHYTGASSNVDTPYSYGDGQHDGLTAEIIADIAAGVTVTTNNDKTGYSLANGAITAAVIATDAIDADALAADAVSEIQSGLATSASITALNNLSAAQVNAEVVDALTTDTYAEPAAVPAATSSLKDKINWIFALARNKLTQTATTQTLRNDADGADIATATVADDGAVATRGEWT